MRRDSLAASAEAHSFGGRRLDVHGSRLDAEIGGEVRAHPGQMRREPRRLCDHGNVGVHDPEPSFVEERGDTAQQDPAVDPGELRVRIGKVPADVAEPRCAEQRVA